MILDDTTCDKMVFTYFYIALYDVRIAAHGLHKENLKKKYIKIDK